MALPTAMGWYGVRLPQPSGADHLRAIFCFQGMDGKLTCDHEGRFVPPSDARTLGVAEWVGPFMRRALAEEALAAGSSAGPAGSPGPSPPGR